MLVQGLLPGVCHRFLSTSVPFRGAVGSAKLAVSWTGCANPCGGETRAAARSIASGEQVCAARRGWFWGNESNARASYLDTGDTRPKPPYSNVGFR